MQEIKVEFTNFHNVYNNYYMEYVINDLYQKSVCIFKIEITSLSMVYYNYQSHLHGLDLE